MQGTSIFCFVLGFIAVRVRTVPGAGSGGGRTLAIDAYCGCGDGGPKPAEAIVGYCIMAG